MHFKGQPDPTLGHLNQPKKVPPTFWDSGYQPVNASDIVMLSPRAAPIKRILSAIATQDG